MSLLFFLWAQPVTLQAASVRVVNLPEMVELADRIFWGRCLSIEPLSDSPVGLPIVEYTFIVEDAIKGVQPGQHLAFRQLDSRAGLRAVIEGLPRYGKGRPMLLFLHADSAAGLTSPVGLMQGAFETVTVPDGEPRLINAFENRNLSAGLDRQEARRAGLSEADVRQLEESGPLRLSTLKRVISRFEQHRLESRKTIR